ncbi:MAG: DinB family protein [Acidobacteriota bacterium]
MFDIDPPRDTDSLRRELRRLQAEITEYMVTFQDDAFFTPQGEHWAPSGHIRHLAKCIRPVAAAMGLPKLVIRLRFGTSKSGSRDFEAVRTQYQAALSDGSAQAGGYAPSSAKPDLSPADWRSQIMGHFEKASQQLDGAFDRWSDRQLDTLRLAHPILGPMTIRELLYFTLYHNAHHARRVRERAAG